MSNYTPIKTDEQNDNIIWIPDNKFMEKYSKFISEAERIFDYERKILELKGYLEDINSQLLKVEDDIVVNNRLIEAVTRNTKGRIDIYNRKIDYIHANKNLFREYDEYIYSAKRHLLRYKLNYKPEDILTTEDILKNVRKEDQKYFSEFSNFSNLGLEWWKSYLPFSGMIINYLWK